MKREKSFKKYLMPLLIALLVFVLIMMVVTPALASYIRSTGKKNSDYTPGQPSEPSLEDPSLEDSWFELTPVNNKLENVYVWVVDQGYPVYVRIELIVAWWRLTDCTCKPERCNTCFDCDDCPECKDGCTNCNGCKDCTGCVPEESDPCPDCGEGECEGCWWDCEHDESGECTHCETCNQPKPCPNCPDCEEGDCDGCEGKCDGCLICDSCKRAEGCESCPDCEEEDCENCNGDCPDCENCEAELADCGICKKADCENGKCWINNYDCPRCNLRTDDDWDIFFQVPVEGEGKDYKLELVGDGSWVKGGEAAENRYYYTKAIGSTKEIGKPLKIEVPAIKGIELLDSAKPPVDEDCLLHVQILVQTVQAIGYTDPDNDGYEEHAWKDAWKDAPSDWLEDALIEDKRRG